MHGLEPSRAVFLVATLLVAFSMLCAPVACCFVCLIDFTLRHTKLFLDFLVLFVQLDTFPKHQTRAPRFPAVFTLAWMLPAIIGVDTFPASFANCSQLAHLSRAIAAFWPLLEAKDNRFMSFLPLLFHVGRVQKPFFVKDVTFLM